MIFIMRRKSFHSPKWQTSLVKNWFSSGNKTQYEKKKLVVQEKCVVIIFTVIKSCLRSILNGFSKKRPLTELLFKFTETYIRSPLALLFLFLLKLQFYIIFWAAVLVRESRHDGVIDFFQTAIYTKVIIYLFLNII